MSAEIKLKFDPSNVKQVAALFSLLSAIGETGIEYSEEEVRNMEVVTEEKPEKSKSKKPKAAKPVKTKVEEPEEEEEAEEENEDSAVSVEQIRELVTSKAKTSKKEIKAKLTDLDADNVSSLDKKHYQEFYLFLSEL